MPWQAVPPLLIIAGAFGLTGVLLKLTDYLAYGKVSDLLKSDPLF
jgi:hypothetical protein